MGALAGGSGIAEAAAPAIWWKAGFREVASSSREGVLAFPTTDYCVPTRV